MKLYLTKKANTFIPSTFGIFLKYHLNSKLTIETTYQKTTPHPHPTPKGVGPASGTMPSKVDCQQAKEKETEEEAVQKILAPGGRKSSLRNTKRTAAATPPREDINKGIRPTGTSSIKDLKDDDLEVDSLKETMSLGLGSTTKSDPSEISSNKEGVDNNSIKASIAAVQANLFKGHMQNSAESEEEPDPTAKSGKKKAISTSWVHAAKAGATPSAEETKQGAVFAAGTQFNEKQNKPAKKTPGKLDLTLFTSVIRIKIHLFDGVPEVQAAIMALLDYCLLMLQERDKHADCSVATKIRKHSRQRTSHRTSPTSTTSGASGMTAHRPS
jgi:hypothetical protein